ncbi:MAG: hypothetical protein MRECE_18c035 [Mycoplasmataceae bacterium CE_OT135]|nr:MAG: hypothetical protein MRECE_18c035 [Mycoplasmataceae bacterium CE_OT135]
MMNSPSILRELTITSHWWDEWLVIEMSPWK